MIFLKIVILTLLALINAEQAPQLQINLGQGTSTVIKLLGLITVLSFGPAIIMSMTTFTRIIIVLGLVRTSLGLQGAPPNLVLIGISLFITGAIMSSVFNQSYTQGVKPYLEGTVDEVTAFNQAVEPLRAFLLANTRQNDLEFFVSLSKLEVKGPEEVPLHVIVPAFVVSELTTAFAIGFFVALPFLIVDIIVASVLASMSMITLPPIAISLPIKLMLFVAVDGWRLLIGALANGFNV